MGKMSRNRVCEGTWRISAFEGNTGVITLLALDRRYKNLNGWVID
jgi:hypothetical protein